MRARLIFTISFWLDQWAFSIMSFSGVRGCCVPTPSISDFPGRQVKFWVRFLPLFTNIKTLSIKKISQEKEKYLKRLWIRYGLSQNNGNWDTLWHVCLFWEVFLFYYCGLGGWVVLNFRPKVCNIKIQNANLTLRTRNQFCTTEKPCNHRSLTGETGDWIIQTEK